MWQLASETTARAFLNQLTQLNIKHFNTVITYERERNIMKKLLVTCLLTSLISFSHSFYTCDHVNAETPQDATDRKIVDLKKTACELLYKLKNTSRIAEKKQIQSQVDSVQDDFFELYDGKTFYFGSLSIPNLRVGDAGVLGTVSVTQIVNANEVHVYKSRQRLILERPTQNVVDDQTLQESTYYCTGTRTYDTVLGGTNTVFVLRPYQKGDVGKIKATHDLPWYDRKGEHVGTGEFVGFIKANSSSKAIFLQDGVRGEVPLSYFNWGDRSFMDMVDAHINGKPSDTVENDAQKNQPRPAVSLD